jgi:hypothetical protein
MLDYVEVDKRLVGWVEDTRAHRGVSVGTDHFLVVRWFKDLFRRLRHYVSLPTTELKHIKVEKALKKKLWRRGVNGDDITGLWNCMKDNDKCSHRSMWRGDKKQGESKRNTMVGCESERSCV